MSSPSPADSFPLRFQVDFDAHYAGIETFAYDVNHPFTFPASPDLSCAFTGLQVSSSPELFSHGPNPPFPFSSPATSETSTLVASPSSTTSNVPSPSPSPPRKAAKATRTPRKAAHKALPRNVPDRVKRSLNAFMLFRRHVTSQRKTMFEKIEKDHSNLSKLVGSMWREKTIEEREPWFAAAAAEKRLHEKKHPDYKFTPVARERKKRRTRRGGKAEDDRIKELARMINEDRPEEEILATAALHASYIASLSQAQRDERREGKEQVLKAPVAEQQIEASASSTLVWAPENAELPAIGVVVDVEPATLTDPMLPPDFLASVSWPYDISLTTADSAYPEYPEYPEYSNASTELSSSYPPTMTTIQHPQADASFLSQYADEQQIYDLFTPAASFPELELELEDSAVQDYSPRFDVQEYLYAPSQNYDLQAVATANVVESWTQTLAELPQPNGKWDNGAWY